jgi:hypothetical protein
VKSRTKTPAFRPGRGGACEATMFRFTAVSHGQSGPAPKSIGALTIDEAFRYMRRRYPEFQIAEIQTGELIELVSGSPVD